MRVLNSAPMDCASAVGASAVHHVMIGAGSLISPGKVLESGMLYIGRPAKPVRALTEAEIANLRYSAEHYIKVKNNYLNGSRK